jgi:hypothetical protein
MLKITRKNYSAKKPKASTIVSSKDSIGSKPAVNQWMHMGYDTTTIELFGYDTKQQHVNIDITLSNDDAMHLLNELTKQLLS